MRKIQELMALRYVQPLREGGSLPAVVDTEAGLFVVKFRGAGQGRRALVAELIVGMLAARLDLPVPELALVEVDPIFGRSEPDPEIQDLLRASHGMNIGLRYLDGAFNFAPPAAREFISAEMAARIVWLDAYTTNPDRTHRNPNLLIWSRRPWLIDHGAAIYAHHDWARVDDTRTRTTFPLIREHVLLTEASDLLAADEFAAARIDLDAIRTILERVPDELLADAPANVPLEEAHAERDRYVRYLATRLEARSGFVTEAITARERLMSDPQKSLGVRR